MKEATTHKRYDHLFDTEHLKEQLKEKAVRGGFSIMTAQMVSFFLRTASMLILARILMPEHFGLIGLGSHVVKLLYGSGEHFSAIDLNLFWGLEVFISHSTNFAAHGGGEQPDIAGFAGGFSENRF